jgi:ribosomal protein L35
MPKLKTCKTAAKRLKKKSGKLLREVKGISHLRSGKTASQRKRTKTSRPLSESDRKVLKKMIPGLK